MAIAAVLVEAGWTEGELRAAYRLITTDGKMAKEVDYSRAITAGVFAKARERREVMRGRLLTTPEARAYCAENSVNLSDTFTPVSAENAPQTPLWRMK